MQRRMFSPEIVEGEEFITMPDSSQNLYFHLGMNADDDGFIQPKLVMRKIGSNDDDLKILLAKRFLLSFDNGVVVIKHWLIHNLIRGDRYKPTRFQEEKKSLVIKENKAYSEKNRLGLQNDNQMAPQVRLGKVRLGEEIPDWLDKKTWELWIEHRKQIKKPLTKVAKGLQFSFLENHKADHVQIINESIKNGWTGLFPLSGRKNEQQGVTKI